MAKLGDFDFYFKKAKTTKFDLVDESNKNRCPKGTTRNKYHRLKSVDFCCEEALTGKKKIKKVYESDNVLAFYHTKPAYNTHIVIIPKKHIHNLVDADRGVLSEILKVAQDILKKIDVDSDGGRLITNLGKFQDTPHLHFHVISDGDYQNIN